MQGVKIVKVSNLQREATGDCFRTGLIVAGEKNTTEDIRQYVIKEHLEGVHAELRVEEVSIKTLPYTMVYQYNGDVGTGTCFRKQK